MPSPIAIPRIRFNDADGNPLANGWLTTYRAGTLTLETTFQDAAGLIQNQNPIHLDANGEAVLFLGDAYAYDFKLEDENLVVQPSPGLSVQSFARVNATSDTLLRDDLADGTDGVLGPNLLGYGVSLAYARGTVGASLNRVITPLNYTGNGLQGAIDFATSIGGATVHIPHGTFTLTAGLTLYANVELMGRGTGTILQCGDGVTAITATGTSGVRLSGAAIRNLTIKKTAGTTGHHVIWTLCDDCVIENVTFDGALGSNPCYAKLNGTRRCNVNNPVFKNGSSIIWNSDDGLTTGNWGEGNSITGSRMNAAKQGHNVIYQKGFRGTDCVAVGSTGAFGCGWVIEYENIDVVLTGCVSYNHVRDGFYVEGNVAFGCRDVQFIGCFGFANGEAGINLDANYKDVQVIGGSYHSNTGAFAAGTGHGFMGSGSQYVTLNGVTLRDNAADGIWYTGAFYLKLDTCSIHDNAGWGVNLQGARSFVKLHGVDFANNTSGTVQNWTYVGSNEWDGGPFESFTPTFYKSNESTVITFTTTVFSYRRVDGMVEYEGYFSTPSAALDGSTFFSVPIVGTWPDNSGGGNALLPRGWAQMDMTGVKCIDGGFANDKLRISTTAAGDTIIRVNGRYEVV